MLLRRRREAGPGVEPTTPAESAPAARSSEADSERAAGGGAEDGVTSSPTASGAPG